MNPCQPNQPATFTEQPTPTLHLAPRTSLKRRTGDSNPTLTPKMGPLYSPKLKLKPKRELNFSLRRAVPVPLLCEPNRTGTDDDGQVRAAKKKDA